MLKIIEKLRAKTLRILRKTPVLRIFAALDFLCFKCGLVFVVKYRTLSELTNVKDKAVLQDALTAVLALLQTQKRLELLKNLDYTDFPSIDVGTCWLYGKEDDVLALSLCC